MAAAGRRGGVERADTKSSATDMVTEFDHASERLIVDRLLAARPYDGVLGEEGAAAAGSSGVHWVIDPIDGTTNFLYGLPSWGVSIAATDALGTIVGAVFVPSSGEMFAAVRGAGATLDGVTIRAGACTELSSALVATGFGYEAERRRRQGARVAALLPHVRDIRRLGAASVDLCYVAAGRIDAYYEEGLGVWDFAAGELIARESGCLTGDFGGGPPSSLEVAVANPVLFPLLRQVLAATSVHSVWATSA